MIRPISFDLNEQTMASNAFQKQKRDESKKKIRAKALKEFDAFVKSREVVEKELVGYSIIATLLDVFVSATNRKYENTLTNYDKLVLNLLPESLRKPKETLYLRILTMCGYVASLTDGFALQLYKKIKG